MSKFGLPPTTIAIIHAIFATEPALQRAVLYGSRAKHTHRPGSDIDLTLFGEGLTETTRSRIAQQLEASPIPYYVDLSLWDQIDNEALRDHVNRIGQVFYERTAP
jgi:predicted nucleotidyltransferase